MAFEATRERCSRAARIDTCSRGDRRRRSRIARASPRAETPPPGRTDRFAPGGTHSARRRAAADGDGGARTTRTRSGWTRIRARMSSRDSGHRRGWTGDASRVGLVKRRGVGLVKRGWFHCTRSCCSLVHPADSWLAFVASFIDATRAAGAMSRASTLAFAAPARARTRASRVSAEPRRAARASTRAAARRSIHPPRDDRRGAGAVRVARRRERRESLRRHTRAHRRGEHDGGVQEDRGAVGGGDPRGVRRGVGGVPRTCTTSHPRSG